MALNKHMAAAVAEIDADIERILSAQVFGTRAEIKRLKAVRDTIDALYGGDEPKAKPKPRKYTSRAVALFNAAKMPAPLTAPELAAASGITAAAASKCMKRWRASGWVKKIFHGQYVRTAKFPAVVIPAE